MKTILLFHGGDYDRAAMLRRIAQAHVGGAARVVSRNGDAFTGWVERSLNGSPVDAICAPDHPQIAEAYLAAGMTVLDHTAWPELQPRRVAILCPGPSLARAWPPQAGTFPYDATIAINRAIEHRPAGFQADWWCCLDAGAWELFHGWPSVGIVGRCASVPAPDGMIRRNLPEDLIHSNVAYNWSTTSAILHAVDELHAARIDLYGADMAGETDFLGMPYGGRSPERWTQESAILANLCDTLARRGIIVTRVPAPAEAQGKPAKAKKGGT